MTPAQIVRAAIPGADDSLCEHILWGRTPFPCGEVWARDIYLAASRWRRAESRGVTLCEFCDRLANAGEYTCESCSAALARARERARDQPEGKL
jgi:hypothetical protein